MHREGNIWVQRFRTLAQRGLSNLVFIVALVNAFPALVAAARRAVELDIPFSIRNELDRYNEFKTYDAKLVMDWLLSIYALKPNN